MSTEEDLILPDGRALSSLKVVDLRKELENRSLPKSGNKKDLSDRLRLYLLSAAPQQQHQYSAPASVPVVNPLVAKYLASQQEALKVAGLNPEIVRTSVNITTTTTTMVEQQDIPREMQVTPPAVCPEQVTEVFQQQQQSIATTTIEAAAPVSASANQQTAEMPVVEDELDYGEEEQPTSQEQEQQQKDGGGKCSSGDSTESQAGSDTNKDEEAQRIDYAAVEDEKQEELAGQKEGGSASGSSSPSAPSSSPSAASNKSENDVEEKKPVDDSQSIVDTKRTSTRPIITYNETSPPATKRPKTEPTTTITPSPTIKQPAALNSDGLPEGLVRRGEPSPSRLPTSTFIHIRGLKRPFTIGQLQTLLSNFGTLQLDHFWIDSIKSNCIAKFETEEQAQKAREALHNSAWTGAGLQDPLMVEFSDEGKLEQCKLNGNTANSNNNKWGSRNTLFGGGVSSSSISGLVVTVDNRTHKDVNVSYDRGAEVKDSTNNTAAAAEGSVSPSRKRKASTDEEPQKTLEDLFKKTTALPCIYYLPLTEEQAEAHAEKRKLRAQQMLDNPPRYSGRDDSRRDSYRGNSGGGGGWRRRDSSPPRRRY